MLSRWVASSSRSSFASSSRSSLPSVPIVSRRSVYSSLPRRNEDIKPESSSETPALTSSSSSTTTTTTSTPSSTLTSTPKPKAPALFTILPDGSVRTSAPRSPRSPPSPRPPTPPRVSRLRQHLLQWTAFKALSEAEMLEVEKKIRKKTKAVADISTTMAKWYSDPIPHLIPAPSEMFGVERNRSQGLSWIPTVGDRVLTPFGSYGIITAIRPAAPKKTHPKKLAQLAAREEAAKPRPFSSENGSDEPFDPTWKKAEETPEVRKLDIEMPADWIMMSSKDGPYAGAVEKKLAMDEARRVRSGGKPKVGSIGRDGKVVKEEMKEVKMVAEVRIEVDHQIRELPLSHPVDGLKYAPLSPANLEALFAETGHYTVQAAQDSGYRPSPSAIASSSWSESKPRSSSSFFNPSQPSPMALRPRSQAGKNVPGREGYLQRFEASERDLKGGEELTGAARRLLDREKRKVWASKEKILEQKMRRERFESFEEPPEGSGIVVRRRPWRVAGGGRKAASGEEDGKEGGKGFGLD